MMEKPSAVLCVLPIVLCSTTTRSLLLLSLGRIAKSSANRPEDFIELI